MRLSAVLLLILSACALASAQASDNSYTVNAAPAVHASQSNDADNSDTSLSAVTMPEYVVTSLEIESISPENGGIDLPPHMMPTIMFNGPIKEAKGFGRIRVYCNDRFVDHDAVVSGNTLTIVPIADIEGKKIRVSIPEQVVANNQGECNRSLELNFSYATAERQKVEKYCGCGRIMENGDLYIWSK